MGDGRLHLVQRKLSLLWKITMLEFVIGFLSRGLWIHEEEQLIRCMNNETCDIATSELLI